MKNKVILFMFFCWLLCINLMAQPFTTNRTGTSPTGTTLIQADIINSNEQITAGDNMSYRCTQNIHLTAGFSASGLSGTDLFHAYLQPMQIVYVLNNAGAETEMPYTSATAYTSVVPQYSRFEIGVQLPADVQTQIDYFLNPNLTQAPNSSYCQTCTPQGINPYDQSKIQIEVDFTDGINTYTRYGFYYQDFSENNNASLSQYMGANPWTALLINYPFRVRFAPPATGAWNFNVILKLNGNPVASFTGASFTVPNLSANHGFLTMDSTLNKMRFNDGTLFYGIGEDIPYADEEAYNTVPAGPFSYQKIRNAIADLYQQKGNFVRIRFDPWSNPVETNEMQVYSNDPSLVKLPVNCINNYQHNQRHMWEFDQTLDLCEQHSVYIMLNLLQDQYFGPINIYGPSRYYWLNNPYKALTGQDDGMDKTGVTTPNDIGIYKFFTDVSAIDAYQNTLFYINARWGYSTNIALWEHINETNNLGAYDTHTQDPNTWQEIYGNYYNNDNGDPSLNAFVTGVQNWTCIMKNYMDNFYPDHIQTTGYGLFRNTDASNLACLDVFSGNDYSGSVTANIDKYSKYTTPNGGIGYVTYSQMNNKPFLLGETGIGCGGAYYTGVDPDAPDNTSDIEFHKSLWSSAFSGNIVTDLHWTDWFETVANDPAPPHGAMHRALNFPALDDFLINVNFNQPLYPQNEYPAGYMGSSYDGSSLDYFYQNPNPLPLQKYVDNFFLLNAPINATQGYGYCYNRSYFWQTDPGISNYASNYMCSNLDHYPVNPGDAYEIGNPPTGYNDPPVHFYNMKPSTTFSLTYFETAGATQVGSATAMSDINGNLDFNLPFGAGANIDAMHPPDYAYVLGLPCIGCQRTAKTNQTKGINNSSSITNNNIDVYPNPANNLVYLNFNAQSAGALLVNISDVNGNQIISNRFATNEGANKFKIDLSKFNPAVYFIHITDENGIFVKNDKLVLIGQ